MSTGAGMFSGAAQGASAGAAFGPWGAAIGGVVGAVGGLLGSRSAKKAAAEAARAREANAVAVETQGRNVQGAYNQFGQNMFDLAGQVGEDYQFNPISARGPYGTVSFQDGQLVNQLDPTGMMLLQGAGNQFGQAMSFDRAGAQADYFKTLQGMYAPQRELQMQGMLRQLQAKGMAGLGSNVNGNMLMKGMASNWGQQDLAASKMAMDYGGSELDAMYNRGYGMLTAANNMANMNMNMWNTGQTQASPFQLGGLGMQYGLLQKAYGAPLQGTISAADFFTNAAGIRSNSQVTQAAQRDAANQGLIGGVVEGIKSIPWGMFGSNSGSSALNQPITGHVGQSNMGYAPAYGGYASPF